LVLVKVIERRHDRERRDGSRQQFERQRLGERKHGGRIGRDHAVEAVPIGPQQPCHQRADQYQLEQPFGQIDQRLSGKKPLDAGGRRSAIEFWLQRLRGPDQRVLHQVAADRGKREQQERNRQGGQHFELELFDQLQQTVGVGIDRVCLADQPAQRGAQAGGGRSAECE